jgi:hypothetical protein
MYDLQGLAVQVRDGKSFSAMLVLPGVWAEGDN